MMRPEHSADIAATQLAALEACVNPARLEALRLVENAEVNVPEVEWRTDAEERAMDSGPRWHYADGGAA